MGRFCPKPFPAFFLPAGIDLRKHPFKKLYTLLKASAALWTNFSLKTNFGALRQTQQLPRVNGNKKCKDRCRLNFSQVQTGHGLCLDHAGLCLHVQGCGGWAGVGGAAWGMSVLAPSARAVKEVVKEL